MSGSDLQNLISCADCARLKIKCDKQLPCSRCHARGIPCKPRNSRRTRTNNNSGSASDQSRRARTTSELNHEGVFALPPSPTSIGHDAEQPGSWSSRSSSGFFTAAEHTVSLAQSNASLSASLEAPILLLYPERHDVLQISSSLPEEQPSDLQAILQSTSNFTFDNVSPFAFNTGMRDVHMSDVPQNVVVEKRVWGNAFASTMAPVRITGSREGLTTNASTLPRLACTTISTFCSFFRCHPKAQCKMTSRNPKTHLRALAGSLAGQDDQVTWWRPEASIDHNLAEPIDIVSFETTARERLQSLTQTILQRGLNAHNIASCNNLDVDLGDQQDASRQAVSTAYVVLPPLATLDLCLHYYAIRIEQYFPSISAGRLDPRQSLTLRNTWMDALIMLLMLAIGSHSANTMSARQFADGIATACRVSLMDALEKDPSLNGNTKALRCALLLTTLSVWSGDNWLMENATGQAGMFLSMLTRTDMLDYAASDRLSIDVSSGEETAWKAWAGQERDNRLAYSWILLDLECSLFFDRGLVLTVDDLDVSMPSDEDLWQAPTAASWHEVLKRKQHVELQTLSLKEVFRRLTEEEQLIGQDSLSLRHLALLLHPIHAMTSHVRQVLACLTPWDNGGKPSYTTARSRIAGTMDDIRRLLQRWYALSTAKSEEAAGSAKHQASVNLVYYHLISLNTMICFKTIEKIARVDAGQGSKSTPWLRHACPQGTEEIFFHGGQIIRLLGTVPDLALPMWWPIAMYRVALILWATSFSEHSNASRALSWPGTAPSQPFIINQVLPNDPSVERFCTFREGTPMLVYSSGEMLTMRNPARLLRFCADRLQSTSPGAMASGVGERLEALAVRSEGIMG